MAVKGKGKQVASSPPSPPISGAKRPKAPSADAGPSSSSSKRRRGRPGVLRFVDDAAGVDDDYEEDEDGDDEEEEGDFENDGSFTKERAENANFKRTGRSHPLPFLGLVKEEQLSGDELEDFIADRYANRVKHTTYGGFTNEQDDDDVLLKEPVIWRVRCMVGRERQMAFCFMQKFVDLQKFGTKVPIISAFALDHVRGFIFVEAEKACDVTEACKGFCSVYVSRINSVPAAEVPSLLSTRTKPLEVSPDTWVRMKNGNYKGDLARVVSVDDGRKRVLIKLIPRVDLQAISRKFGGAISLKEAAVPAPRLISSQELEFFRPHIEMKRDRQTGEVFEVLDGLMFKDGLLYKRVALSSLIYWGVQPTPTEVLKFTSRPTDKSSADDLAWVSSIYGHKKRDVPDEQDMKASSSKASSSKSKCSKASNLKASTSTENYDDDEFNLHDLVLFGRKDFGVIVAVEKDGFRILKGSPEGSALTVRKQDIKKVCIDKMFTALDHKKKIVSVNDTVKVLEGQFEGKEGIVKHLYLGILFIYNESENENNGFFCAYCGSCENVKKRKELADSPGPMFSYEQNEQREIARPYRSAREQLFSIGEMLRIRKGPLKGYLCRVVRIFRNDITVKLDSLLKIVTVQAEFLSAPTKRGDNSSDAPSGPFGNQDKPFFGSEADKTSWDNGLPSFGSDSWQPFSSSALPVQNADGESEADPWCKKTTSADDSDPWGTKPNSASVEVWNNSTTQKESSSDDAWDKQAGGSGSNVGGSSWDIAAVNKESEKSDNWGEACRVTEGTGNDTDPWGSKVKEVDAKETDSWGKASMPAEKKSDDDIHGWGQPVSKSNQDLEKGPDLKDADKSGAWDNVITNCIGSSLSVPGKGDDDVWAKSSTLPVSQDNAWGKSKDNSSDVAVGWNEGKPSNQNNWKSSWDNDTSGKSSWSSGNQVDNKAEDSGGFRGRGRGRGQCGGRGRGRDNGFGRGDGGSADWDKGASNKGSWGTGDNRNAINSSITQPWSSSGGIKSSDENQISTWNSSENKESSRGEKNDPWASKAGSKDQEQQTDAWASKTASTAGAEDKSDGWDTKAKDSSVSTGGEWENSASGEEPQSDPWASKIGSTKGKEQEIDPWTSKVTSAADADDNSNGWNTKAKETASGSEGKWGNAGTEVKADAWNNKGSNENSGGWNNAGSSWGKESSWGNKPSFSTRDEEPAWSKPKFGADNTECGRGGFGRGNRGRGRGRNFGDSASTWSGGSNGKDESGGERSEDRWNRRDFDGGRGRGRGRFGRGDRNQGNNFGSGDNNGGRWGSGRGNRDGGGGGYQSSNDNNDSRPFSQGGGWSQSSDWNADKGSTGQGQSFSKGKSSWGTDKNDTWGAPKPSGGDGQAGKNDGSTSWSQNKSTAGNGSSILGQWGGSPPGDDTTTGWGSVGKSSWGSDKTDSWGAPKPSGGDDQTGKKDGNTSWSQNKSTAGNESSILGQWGAPPSNTTTGGGSAGTGGSWEKSTEDSWNSSRGPSGSGMSTEKSSWGGPEAAGAKKEEGSWDKGEGSGSQGGGGSSWDKADGGWNTKGGDAGKGGW